MSVAWSNAAFLTTSRDTITALQSERLSTVITRAFDRVPHYQSTFRAAGVHPSDFARIEDIVKFPFTDKAVLRANYPFGLLAVPREELVRIHGSSGTTGKSTVVGYTRRDCETWSNLMARCLHVAGAKPGDMFHNAYGYGLFTGGLGLHHGAEALGCTVVPASGGVTARQVSLINDLRPQIIGATPSYLLTIADEFQRQSLDGRASSLRLAICGAEPWSEGMRFEIEERLGLEALDLYGLSELMGPGVAQEFKETRDGPTIWEDHFFPEIIDPETGASLPDGERGELVLTSLTREAMPLIRYRTRDLTRLLPGTASKMRRIERISGRSDDMMIIRGVNVFPSQIEELIAMEQRLSFQYLIEIDRPDRLDVATVTVESREALDDSTQSELARRLEATIKATIGISADVAIARPATLKPSEGKAVRVVDRRPK